MSESHAEALATLQAEAADWKAKAEARMEELVAMAAAAAGVDAEAVRTDIRGLIIARAEAEARPRKLVERAAELVALLQQCDRTFVALEAAAWKQATEEMEGLINRPDIEDVLEQFATMARGGE